MSDPTNKKKASGATDVKAPARVAFAECQHAELESEADVFYAFFILRNRFWSVHRRFNLDLPDFAPHPDRYRSHIILSEYERSSKGLTRISESFLCVGEDPRVVSDGERAFVVCRGGLHERHDGQDHYKVVALPEAVETTVVMPRGIKVGKNWQPFLKDGRLYAIHGFAPLTILEIGADGEAKVAHCEDTELMLPARHDRFTIARGGCNAVTEGDHVIGVGHFTTDRHIHWPFFWSLDPSMQIGITIPGRFFGLRKKGFNIIDPTSLFRHDGKVFLGLCASERDWFYGQRFLNLLVELPISDFNNLLRHENQRLFADIKDKRVSGLSETKTFVPEQMLHQIPAEAANGGIQSIGKKGCLVHGPYEPIEAAGRFRATLTYSCSGRTERTICGHFDVSCFKDGNVEILASCALSGINGEVHSAAIDFSTDGYIGGLLETRVFVEKRAGLNAYSIRIAEAEGGAT